MSVPRPLYFLQHWGVLPDNKEGTRRRRGLLTTACFYDARLTSKAFSNGERASPGRDVARGVSFLCAPRAGGGFDCLGLLRTEEWPQTTKAKTATRLCAQRQSRFSRSLCTLGLRVDLLFCSHRVGFSDCPSPVETSSHRSRVVWPVERGAFRHTVVVGVASQCPAETLGSSTWAAGCHRPFYRLLYRSAGHCTSAVNLLRRHLRTRETAAGKWPAGQPISLGFAVLVPTLPAGIELNLVAIRIHLAAF